MSESLFPPRSPHGRLWGLTSALSGAASALRARRLLPRPVADFRRRAVARAIRLRDGWSLRSTLPLEELAALLELAGSRRDLVELGTGTGWTALSLALNDPECAVVTYDPRHVPVRDEYLRLVDRPTRQRILVVAQRGELLERAPAQVDLLLVDSRHLHEIVVESFHAWEGRLAPDALVVFDDYDDPRFPGVKSAVDELGLEGDVCGRLFVWRAKAPARRPAC